MTDKSGRTDDPVQVGTGFYVHRTTENDPIFLKQIAFYGKPKDVYFALLMRPIPYRMPIHTKISIFDIHGNVVLLQEMEDIFVPDETGFLSVEITIPIKQPGRVSVWLEADGVVIREDASISVVQES